MPRYSESPSSPAAPIAKVIIRVLGGSASIGDVPMLIDTGSDITLIPKVAVDFLGIPAEPNEQQRLIAFDGSASVYESVYADLKLEGKSYKGLYVVIDQTCGVLGRDVLNHVCLVLDGPSQVWEIR